METEQFEALCVSLYELTPGQRERLHDLLSSRHWFYEDMAAGTLDLELLYEARSRSLMRWLEAVSIDDLAMALKGTSLALREKLHRLMPPATSATISQKMEELGCIRRSEKEAAEQRITDIWKSLQDDDKVCAVPLGKAVGLAPQPFGDAQDEFRRRVRRRFYLFTNEELTIVLKDLPAEMLADMLGYLNDPKLIRRFLLAAYPEKGQAILDRLLLDWPMTMNTNPEVDHSQLWSLSAQLLAHPGEQVKLMRGREALDKVMVHFGQLIDEGQVAAG